MQADLSSEVDAEEETGDSSTVRGEGKGSEMQADLLSEEDAEEETAERPSTSFAQTESSSLITAASDLDYDAMFTDRDMNTSWTAGGASQIRLEGDIVETRGEGLAVDGNSVVIRKAGTYHVTGTMEDGQIVIETPDDEKVQLVLDGADITCSTSACILIRSADKVFITLADGTKNRLADTELTYVQSDETMNVDAVVFSKSDLVFNGKGSLSVEAGYQDGIVSKDDLKFTGGTYEIRAAGKGIVGKDSLRIRDGVFTIVSEDDALHTSNSEKAGKGYLYIEGGSYTITAGDDAVHAATALIIEDGSFEILKCYEGLEGDTIDIDGGEIRLTATDDGLNAAMSGTTENMDLPQDAAGMDGTDRPAMAEGGFEGPAGKDDGTGRPALPEGGFDGPAGMDESDRNAMPEDGFGGPAGMDGTDRPALPEGGFDDPDRRGRRDDGAAGSTGDAAGKDFGGGRKDASGAFMMMDVQEDCCLHITGGTLYVSAEGDGLDSNGTILIEGGSIIVDGPTNEGNGAIDCGVEAVIRGGTIAAAGSSGMAENFSENSTQYSILYCFSGTVAADTEISLEDERGKKILSMTPSKACTSIVFSAPELGEGTFTIRAGEEEAQIEVTSVSTTAGNSTGGMHGGTGGMHGGGTR